jgi:hypothetical protein
VWFWKNTLKSLAGKGWLINICIEEKGISSGAESPCLSSSFGGAEAPLPNVIYETDSNYKTG